MHLNVQGGSFVEIYSGGGKGWSPLDVVIGIWVNGCQIHINKLFPKSAGLWNTLTSISLDIFLSHKTCWNYEDREKIQQLCLNYNSAHIIEPQ